MLQPPAMPRFQEDSALKRHWPLIWLTVLVFTSGLSVEADFSMLGRVFERHPRQALVYATSYISPRSNQRLCHSFPVNLNDRTRERQDDRVVYRPLNAAERQARLRAEGTQCARQIFSRVEFGSGMSKKNMADGSREFLQWVFHRKLGFYLLQRDDDEGARSEFESALHFAKLLGPRTPCLAYSLSDLSLLAELRALQMQQVSDWLLRVALPIFSFFAALLPFALFLHFMKSRDRDAVLNETGAAGMARLLIKTALLASWFAAVLTGWVALRNYGLGLVDGAGDPVVSACGAALGALLISFCMMLRYMPPYKSLSLKRTLVGFGFGGLLIAIKSLTIYWALCLSLAGHPALKEALFSEHLFFEKTSQAKAFAADALAAAKNASSLSRDQRLQITWWMQNILQRPAGQVEVYRQSNIANVLTQRGHQNIAVAGLPYLWDTSFVVPRYRPTYRQTAETSAVREDNFNVDVNKISIALTIKACLAYFLIFCPEMLAYILLGFRQRPLALSAFNSAVQIKEYFFGIDHWIVIGMLEMYGSCLLSLKGNADLRVVGEDYLRQAIFRYERSRGRHDQLTISAKMSLALIYSERGDDKQAEKILTEALRDVGKDFDTLAYCALLSEIGRLYCKRNNYSRAKQMYKQVIDLLEQKLSKAPSRRGLGGYLRNVYATIPSWQLELKLAAAYLDLAEVFHQAKYNGEAQRLTEDAGKLVSKCESDLCVINEVAAVYVRARLAQARILSSHGRIDDCFKLLAAAYKQLCKWGYRRSHVGFEFCVGRSEIESAGSRGLANYFEMAKKNYLVGRNVFGDCGTLSPGSQLVERWAKVGVIFGTTHVLRQQKAGTASWSGVVGAQDEAVGFSVASSSSSSLSAAASPAAAISALAALERAADAKLPPLAAARAEVSEGAVSKLIKEAQASPEESIVLRWQREHQEEKIYS